MAPAALEYLTPKREVGTQIIGMVGAFASCS